VAKSVNRPLIFSLALSGFKEIYFLHDFQLPAKFATGQIDWLLRRMAPSQLLETGYKAGNEQLREAEIG
jgi:hypothetical protein